jgi:hypothetical protein
MTNWSSGAAASFEPAPLHPPGCTPSVESQEWPDHQANTHQHGPRRPGLLPNASPPDNRLTRTGVVVMRKAVFTTVRALFVAGATGVLGIAVLAAPAAAWGPHGCTQSNPCTLAFTADGQPAGTTVNTTITPSFDSPAGGPVKVEVLDASGHLVTSSKAAVTIAITATANPGSGTLSGTTTLNTIGGVASFSDLSINQPGIGYRLTATSYGMNPATSAHFTIWGSLQPCSTTPCSASASSATTSGTATTSSAGSAQFLGTGIGGGSYSCAGTYQPVSDPFSFDVVSGSGDTQPGAQFAVTLQIDKTLVQSSGHPGASSWQICYASMSPFTAQPGTSGTTTIGDVTFDTGLLPNCRPDDENPGSPQRPDYQQRLSHTPVPPCVQARHKDHAGDVIVTFLASGDPLGKG